MVNVWGPAILVCLTVIVGILFNNSRITDLQNEMNALEKRIDGRFDANEKRIDGRFDANEKRIDGRFDANEKHFDARFAALDKRFDDLKDWIRAELRRLEERSSPVQRG